MTHSKIREKFLKFFESRGHKIVPSSSLLPTDPSVLFTTAGMQQFKDYYTNPENAPAQNVVSIQKCLRTSDIDEVGDESHLTFFEMLGNFSFGGYFKEDAIKWAHEFITNELNLKISHVTVFGGVDFYGSHVPADDESEKIWKKVDPKLEVKKEGREDNFWGPTGDEGPCGPTTEIYVDGIEIWNIVFNQYYQHKDKKLEPLKISGIDTGMGLERLVMVVQNKKNVFETDLLDPILENTPSDMDIKVRRIITDHSRSVSFMTSDGVTPSNKDQGYVLRRLIRRIMTYSYLYLTREQRNIVLFNYEDLIEVVCREYKEFYGNLDVEKVRDVISQEYIKFNKALGQGVNELKKFFGKFIQGMDPQNPGGPIIRNNVISGRGLGLELFKIYESKGLHPDIAKDILQLWGLNLDPTIIKEYENAITDAEMKHKEISRAGAEKKFGGHGLLMDTGELKAGNEEELKKATRLHTATHLLHASLRKVLGTEVHQAGSDITAERLRFDFTFPRKLTPEEIKQVEDLVNEAVQKDYPVTKEEMSYEDAIKSGAMAFFKLKYPPRVNVYSVGDFSKELCGGPHVSHSSEIGKFKITKEEAVSAGIRRIRATVD